MRKADIFLGAGWLAVMAAGLVLGVSACDSSADKSAATAAGSVSKAHKKPKIAGGRSGEDNLADMVAAVSASKPGPPVELKFALPVRPEVGQLTELDIAVVPRAPVPESVSVSFQVADGLELIEGSRLEPVDKLVDGAPIRHVVKVLPKRDGIFALTAVVSFVVDSQDLTRTFSIPVIAGEGLPEQVAKGP